MVEQGGPNPDPGEVHCAECNTLLVEGQDRVVTDDGVFCRPCYNNLTAQLQQVLAAQGADINYPGALVGALLGAAAGVLLWWGFTVVTKIAFGLVAVVIGVAVGKGVVLMSGGKRHFNLQILSVLVSVAAFVYASYLVNRTLIQRTMAERGEPMALPLVPAPDLFFQVFKVGFGIMDVVFLAIVVYEAWRIPAPIRLGGGAPA